MLTNEEKIILGAIFMLREASMTTLRFFLSGKVPISFGTVSAQQLQSLQKHGWLEEGTRKERYRCTPKVNVQFLKEIANATYFENVLTRAEGMLSAHTNYPEMPTYWGSYVGFAVNVMGILRHDEEVGERLEAIRKKRSGNYNYGYVFYNNEDFRPYVYRFLASDPTFALDMPSYSLEFQLAMLPEFINSSMTYAELLPDWRQYCLLTDLSRENRWLLMTASFLEVDVKTLEQLAQTDEPNARILFEAYTNTLRGDWKTADARFTRFFNATGIMDKMRGTALLKTMGFIPILIGCIAEGSKGRISTWMSNLYSQAEIQWHFSQLQDAVKNHAFHKNWKLSSPNWEPVLHLVDAVLLAQLFSYTPESEILKVFEKDGLRYFDAKMPALGVYMLSAIASRLPGDAPERNDYLERIQSYPLEPIVNVKAYNAQWQTALEMLTKLADSTSKNNQQSESKQLGWLLHCEKIKGSDFQELKWIMLCTRTFSAKGKSTSWRVASTNGLRCGHYNSMLSLEEQNIKNQVYHSYSYDTIDPVNIVHLVHSEFVFLGDFSSPVRLVEEKNAIVSRFNSKGETELTLKYQHATSEGGVFLDCSEKETVRFAVVNAKDDRLYQLFLQFNGKIVVPPEGREQLAETASKISKTVPFSGVLMQDAYQNLQQVDGRTELHAFITAEASGYKVDFRCKPHPECELFMLPGRGTEQRIITVGEDKLLLKRNLKQEKKVFENMIEQCPSLTELEDDGADLTDVSEFLPALMEIKAAGFILDWKEGKPLKLIPKVQASALRLSCNKMEDWFSIDGELKISDELAISLQELLNHLDEGGSFIRLDEDSYLQLTKELKRKLEALKAAAVPSKKQLKVSPAALPMLSTVFEGGLPEELEKQLERVKAAFATDIPMPKNFQGTLRPYQEDGIRYLARLADCRIGCCLADDMGLGKTIQLLALLLREAKNGPALVVCPASLCRNWEREALRFAPSLHTSILPQINRKEYLKSLGKGDLLLCSYGILQNESELFEGIKWHIVILDEAQAIKNYTAKRTQSTKRMQADIRIASTGTPVENNLLELWSIFDFLNPGLLGTAKDFETRFCQDGMPLPSLKRLVAPLIMRRKKSEVLDDLPPKTEITIQVPLTEKEKALYEMLRLRAMEKLQGVEPTTSRIAILAELTRLRRFCCHPSLVDKSLEVLQEGSKIQRLMELVHELREAGNRTLIFSQYVDFLQLVRGIFNHERIPYQYLDGSTPPAARMKAVDDFQMGQGDFFLISLKAGGTGLNLTAASYVILTDPWWNPAVEQQAADRVHRIGQTQPVTIYRLIASNTVEEKVLELHARKRMSSEEILSESESTGVTIEELMSLFSR